MVTTVFFLRQTFITYTWQYTKYMYLSSVTA